MENNDHKEIDKDKQSDLESKWDGLLNAETSPDAKALLIEPQQNITYKDK